MKSLRESTFRDCEILVVDDQSTDDSFKLAQSLATEDDRIQVFRNEKNLGQFGNRNRAAELAKGEFIKYLDSDDMIYPHSLEIMHSTITAVHDASHAVCCPAVNFPQPFPIQLTPIEAYKEQFLNRGCLSAGPSGSIIRRTCFHEIGGYREVGVAGDVDLWYRLAARWNTVLMQPALIWWRQHENQAFTDGTAELDYLRGDYRIAMDALTSPDCPLEPGETSRAIQRCQQHQARKLIRLATKKRRPFLARQIAKECGLGVRDLLSGLRRYS